MHQTNWKKKQLKWLTMKNLTRYDPYKNQQKNPKLSFQQLETLESFNLSNLFQNNKSLNSLMSTNGQNQEESFELQMREEEQREGA